MRRRATAVLTALLALAAVFGIGSSSGATTRAGATQAVGSSVASVPPGASGRLGSRPRAGDARPAHQARIDAVVGGSAVSYAASAHGPVPGVVTENFVRPPARQSVIIRAAAVHMVAGVPRGAVSGRAPPSSTGF